MADNIAVTPGSGASVATDDVSSVHYQIMKMAYGPLNTATLVDTTNGFPVQIIGTPAVTVSGVATAAHQVTQNGYLDGLEALLTTIDADTSALAASITANKVQVDVVSTALPTGAATAANQTTMIGHLDGVEGFLTTLAGAVRAEDAASADAHTGFVNLAVRKATPANTSGTDGDYEMLQMSAGRLWVSAAIDTALPAGANAIGKLAANSGVDIGDVDVLSIVPGVGATNLGKAEDAAHTSGDTGVMALAVRNDNAATARSGADGDYTAIAVEASGAVLTRDRPAPTATLTNVASSATNVTLVAANAARRGVTIHNDSTAVLYVKFGATASATSYTVKMVADSYYEVPFGYSGIIDGIWAAANGNARVTELT